MTMIYPGRKPSNVNKDAKYTIKQGRNGWEVNLVFRLNTREVALLSSDSHDALIDMVNTVKEAVNGVPGGSFYINEFSDVIVPSTDGESYFAGIYTRVLAFDLDGSVISSEPPAGLAPGDVWPGPRAGVPYTLTADGSDIKYKEKSGRIEREVYLSDYTTSSAAAELAARIRKHKGQGGGRFYINERCHFFGPVSGGDPSEFIYFGSLDDSPWFPPPDVPGRD